MSIREEREASQQCKGADAGVCALVWLLCVGIYLARLIGFRRTVLQLVQVRRRVIFLVVFAFLWKTGLVCPPKPACLLSYRRLPCATSEALPALYCVTLKTWWFLHLGALQKVFVVFGAFTIAARRGDRVARSALGAHNFYRERGGNAASRVAASRG